MIRINLLPAKKSRKAEKGQRLILVAALLLAGSIAAMFLLHAQSKDKVADAEKVVKALRESAFVLQKETDAYGDLEKEKTELLSRQSAIQALRDARQTPTWALDELSQILSKNRRPPSATHPGSGPTMTVDMKKRVASDKNLQFSESWDPRKIWITSITEKDHSLVLHGGAQSDKDVTQFTYRLQASVYFQYLGGEGAEEEHPILKIPYQRWTIQAKVLY